MKAMILAAGRGERMRPLTDSLPKPLLRVGQSSLIEHHIRRLAEAGVKELVINHCHLGHLIEEALGDGVALGVSIQYSAENEMLETAGGIHKALPLLGEEPFLVLNGDVWTDYPFQKLVGKNVEQAHVVLVANPEHNPDGDFALRNGMAKSDGAVKYTFSGIGKYHPRFFQHCQPGRFPLAPLLREAMARDQVSGELYEGDWRDIGTPERLQQLDRQLKQQA